MRGGKRLGGLLLCQACMLASPSQQGTATSPFFLSSEDSYRVEVGGKVLLKCAVENLGESTLIWKKDGRMISAGRTIIRKDPRMSLVDTSLEILEVRPEDAGTYFCNVETYGEPLDQAHTLDVLVPPSVQAQPSNGKFVVRAGSTITLECRAQGNPMPRVAWTRQNSMMPSGEKSRVGSSVVVEQVTRHDAGVYVCNAENGVGKPASAQISLQVLYPPEIEIEQSWVRSDHGVEAEISCVVHAEPLATVRWYKETMVLDGSDRRRMEEFGKKHLLLLGSMDRHDFGNYSCLAENSLGRQRATVAVSGRPQPAQVTSPLVSQLRDQYSLAWTVQSFLRIEEARILYRRLMKDGSNSDWTNIIPTLNDGHAMTSVSGLTYKGHFTFFGLAPGSDYEVIIQTRNKEGWADPSPIFKFTTRPKNSSPLEMQLRDQSLLNSSPISFSPNCILILLLIKSFL